MFQGALSGCFYISVVIALHNRDSKLRLCCYFLLQTSNLTKVAINRNQGGH